MAINGKSIRIGNEILKQVGSLKEGIIPAMQMLEAGYNEMKEHLDTSSSRELLPATNIMKEVNEGIRNIENLFHPTKRLLSDHIKKRNLSLNPSDVASSAEGEVDSGSRYDLLDLPNIGERRSLLKNKGYAWKTERESVLKAMKDSQNTSSDSKNVANPVVVSKRIRKTKKEHFMIQKQKEVDDSLR